MEWSRRILLQRWGGKKERQRLRKGGSAVFLKGLRLHGLRQHTRALRGRLQRARVCPLVLHSEPLRRWRLSVLYRDTIGNWPSDLLRLRTVLFGNGKVARLPTDAVHRNDDLAALPLLLRNTSARDDRGTETGRRRCESRNDHLRSQLRLLDRSQGQGGRPRVPLRDLRGGLAEPLLRRPETRRQGKGPSRKQGTLPTERLHPLRPALHGPDLPAVCGKAPALPRQQQRPLCRDAVGQRLGVQPHERVHGRVWAHQADENSRRGPAGQLRPLLCRRRPRRYAGRHGAAKPVQLEHRLRNGPEAILRCRRTEGQALRAVREPQRLQRRRQGLLEERCTEREAARVSAAVEHPPALRQRRPLHRARLGGVDLSGP